MITGKSTHNQRIERFWKDVFEGVLSFFYALFYFMEDQGILNPLLDSNIAALHYVFMDAINNKLQIWSRAWCHHRLRTTKSSPLQLWIAGQYQSPQGIYLSPDQAENYGVEGNASESENEGGRPVFSLPNTITQDCMLELENQMNTVSFEENYGIAAYLKAAAIINEHM